MEDVARALLAKIRKGSFGDVDDSHEVCVDLGAEVVDWRVFDREEVGVACVVDEEVDTAEFVKGGFDGRLGFIVVGDVQLKSEDLIFSIGIDEFLESGCVTGCCYDLVAALEGVLRDGCSKTFGGACDEPDLWRHFDVEMV